MWTIGDHVREEIAAAHRAEAARDFALAFRHLERAHVLGQSVTGYHVRVHALMLGWAWRRRDLKEAAGQIVRIAGAATKTAFGLIPTGNTGGANVSAFREMPVPADLTEILRNSGQAH